MVPSDFARVAWVVGLEQERIETLSQIVPATEFFFRKALDFDEPALKTLKAPGVKEALGRTLEAFRGCPDWEPEPLEVIGRAVVAEAGLSAKQVFQPIRAAVTGRLASPPLFDTLAALGRELSLARLERAAGL